MTTKAELRTSIARDIRDPGFAVFDIQQVDDLLEDGIVEVGLAYPLQIVEIVSPIPATYYYPVRCDHAFRVEMYRDNGFYQTLTQSDGQSDSGWDIHAHTLFVPNNLIDNITIETDDIRLWGYAPRLRPVADGEVLELDDRAEFAVRAYAKWQAYQLLASDRTVFKQWQAQTKNTDVSINQVLQTSSVYGRDWERKRNHLRTVRRA